MVASHASPSHAHASTSCADHAALKDVVKTFADNGGRFYDATLGNAANQQFSIQDVDGYLVTVHDRATRG